MSEKAINAAPGQYLTFLVGREEYALNVLQVREVVQAVPITRVPSTPADVPGVVNLRGSVVPVIDLRLRFEVAGNDPTPRACIVVVECEGTSDPVVGLLVDAVNQVVDLGTDQIEPVPAFGTAARADYLGGIAVVGSSFVQILVAGRAASVRPEPTRAAS